MASSISQSILLLEMALPISQSILLLEVASPISQSILLLEVKISIYFFLLEQISVGCKTMKTENHNHFSEHALFCGPARSLDRVATSILPTYEFVCNDCFK